MDQLAAIRIVFGDGVHEKRLTLTFNFLSSLVGFAIVLTALWSIAAGTLKAGTDFQQFMAWFPAGSGVSEWFRWPLLPVLLITYAAAILGVALLLFLATASLGAFIGFLFGVPRPISESGPVSAQAAAPTIAASDKEGEGSGASATSSNSGPTPAGLRTVPAPGWQANTNLTQISDWLTKIIVGVGLVESRQLWDSASKTSASVTSAFLPGTFGTKLAVPALMLSGLIFGFMYSYLFTQLYLATLMSQTDRAIRTDFDLFAAFPVSSTVLAQISSADPVIAPSIGESRSAAPRFPAPTPTSVQRDAATDVIATPLSEVNDPNSVTVWARAQAVLDNWKPAVAAYSKLLAMRKTPEILIEAARVFASAKDMRRARDLLQEAVDSASNADPPARARITFDAAYLALYEPAPEGYQQALQLLGADIVDKDTDGGLHVLRACANGQRYQDEKEPLPEEDKRALRLSVLNDLREAMRYPKNRDWILYLLGRNPDGSVRSPAPDLDDDDLFPFKDDAEFLKLVGL